MIHYFAYGSNMDLEALQKLGVCIYHAEKGILLGWKLVFNVIDDEIPGAGFANLEPDRHAQVEGIIWTIDHPSVTALDRYEDYPRDYDKITLDIQTEYHQIRTCLLYIGQPDRCSPHLQPTQPYLQSLLNGRGFLSPAYYQKLVNLKSFDWK
jgi:gamma-glutamylcyclotransferase (GGCT)/AIG2-like uncharacterized protein YtfP